MYTAPLHIHVFIVTCMALNFFLWGTGGGGGRALTI